MPPQESRPCRWYQYRLRTLLLLIALTAVGISVFQAYIQPFRAQRRAAEHLASLGAQIEYQPGAPAWLRAFAGEDRFLDVVMVHLERRRFDDDDLAVLADLPRLERLYLASTPLTDEGLRHVARLGRLRRMSLWDTRITDEGVAHLAGLTELEVLDIKTHGLTEAALESFRNHPNLTRLLHYIPLGDAGIDALGSMRRLRVEHLACTDVTDEGLGLLARLWPLVSLDINSVHVTDAGLAHVSRLERLQRLTLRGCAATDDGIVRLATRRALESLGLIDVPVTDACLPALAHDPHLTSLTVQNTNVTFGEVARHFGPRATRLVIGRHIMNLSSHSLSIMLTGPTDADVEHLRHFPNVVSLSITRRTKQASEGENASSGLDFQLARAEWLPRLSRLRTLELNSPLDDQDAAMLGRLRQLHRLDLAGRVHVSPDGLMRLVRLDALEHLTMRSCGLTDDHLAFLAEMPQLQVLEIPGNRITRAGIEHLSNLSKLRRLNVSYCPEIDDEAFERISRLESLEGLSAQMTQVTDAGLAYLFDMPHLRDVTVLGSRATRIGLGALRGALPTQGGSVY
jgi:hypothetical protein